MWSMIAATICVLLAVWGVPVRSDGDCMYNTCAYKFGGYGFHEPCMGTNGRGLVRNVECEDGNTIHICCKMPYRTDVQKSRQKWFRFVTWTVTRTNVSPNCVKRILCEQSCKDGLTGQTRSDYPQVLPDDSPENREFVEAYNQGERQSCFNHNKTGEDKKQEKQENLYDSTTCEDNCKLKYSECEKDMENSLKTEYIYESSRIFHTLGMWSFSANWFVQDSFDKLVGKRVKALQAVKRGYEYLHGKMQKMDRAFTNWLDSSKPEQNGLDKADRKRRDVSGSDTMDNVAQEWNQFLVSYNETDSKLVDIVYESLNYTQFKNALNVVNVTLATYDFGPDEWVDNGSGSAFFFIFPAKPGVLAIIIYFHGKFVY